MADIINSDNKDSAYFRTLEVWSEVYNYEQYQLSEHRLRSRILDCIVAIWNVKDWLKNQSQHCHLDVEKEVNLRQYLPIIADLANQVKHRKLDRRPRSGTGASFTNYHGAIYNGKLKLNRNLHFVQDGKSNIVEIFEVLRGALDEWEEIIDKSYEQSESEGKG